MGLNDIKFIKGQGGLGRPLTGEDHVSGLIFYTGSLPSGFSSTDRIKKVFSVAEVETLGILNNYNDETQATGVYTVSNKGADGDTIVFKFTEPDGTVVTLGSYTKVAGDSTVTLVATAIVAAINALTRVHGYSAVVGTSGAFTLTVRKGLGVYPNSGTPWVETIVGTIAGSITTALTGGVASKQAVWHYHLSEYFRVQPKGELYLGFFAVPGGAYDFAEITTMQNFALGKIRQIGIFKDSAAFSTANITTIQNVCLALDAVHKPISSVLYAADISGTANVSSLTDLGDFTNYKVSAIIGQDGGGLGFRLFKATGKSVTCLGATLGAVSLSKVSEDIAWVGKFQMSNGIELDTLAFANGQKYTDISDSLLDTLNTYRYIFLRKFVGTSGSYFNDSHTCVSVASDYAYIENNRTIDRAIRGMYLSLLPEIASPLQLNEDGTLSDITIAHLESVALPNLDQMVRDGDLSGRAVFINPTQDVLATSKVVVTAELLAKGVARNIEVGIGYVKSL